MKPPTYIHRIRGWEEGTLYWAIWNIVENGEWKESLSRLAQRIPDVTFPLGENRFRNMQLDKGDLHFPVIAWRSVWHFVGGMTVLLLPFGMVQETKDGYLGVKTWIDVLTWNLGSWTTGGLIYAYA